VNFDKINMNARLNSEDMNWEKDPITSTILIFILGAIIVVGIVWKLTELDFGNSLLLGLTIWTLFYLIFLFKYFWVYNKGNYACVLTRVLVGSDKKIKSDTSIIDETAIPTGQRGVPPGLHAKRIDEVMVGEPINMVKGTECKVTLSIPDSLNIMFLVTWSVTLPPIPGKYLPRYLLIDDKAADQFFKGRISSVIQSKFAQIDGTLKSQDINVFSKECLGEIFGGEDKVCPEERQMGRFTKNLVISSIVKDLRGQQAAEYAVIAKQQADAIKTIRDSCGGDNTLAAVAISKLFGGAENLINFQKLDITGLDGGADPKGGKK
jgi:hypothetical protein